MGTPLRFAAVQAPSLPAHCHPCEGLLYMDGVDSLGRPVVVLNAGAHGHLQPCCDKQVEQHWWLLWMLCSDCSACADTPLAPSSPVTLRCTPHLTAARLRLPTCCTDAVAPNMKASALVFVKAHLEPLVNQVGSWAE